MNFSQIEREYLIRKTGTVKPLNELKKLWYSSQGATGYSVADMEKSWLRIAIGAAGGTPSGNYTADLWNQLCSVSGLEVSSLEQENKRRYYVSH